jgi:hypothetical protein
MKNVRDCHSKAIITRLNDASVSFQLKSGAAQ